ncbi:MAG: hypothetical protein DWQ47_13250 [Acidobacteria bacterium]|nr:MAG: hypothetical protein DWQ32_00650 [Acidobacteriota bacterium]REK02955.1 MAG: hypothetical protein DWQ38_11485 [Acidobacteriota bacterium]REK13241.1 MAG: hypothetical protein DWQ43_06340 [Acidobacteriota bacterium]REK41235.1 MAG: hypothetical protein DWQ47_13250 [Acidobacteriota bacterium]
MSDRPTVSGIFERAQEMRAASPDTSFDEIKGQLVSEFTGKEFPSPAFLTIPELDNIAPEEDWTAGLPIVLRGIQNEDWNDVALGIVISLEQVENYPKESGREDDPEKDWRNREKRIKEVTSKSVGKWLPEDLMNVAKRSAKQ